MAIRKIRTIGDEILRKHCKPVKEITPRIEDLVEDMFETMYEACGVGLAAPQVGVLKQIVVIDVEDGNQYAVSYTHLSARTAILRPAPSRERSTSSPAFMDTGLALYVSSMMVMPFTRQICCLF